MLQSAIQSVDTSRWNAVVARDRAAAGTFVYAVRSTGVYCRPGCASRRPRRDRVDFFDTPADAERAGFRPCRRCRPREAAASDPWIERIRRACVYLANVEGHLPLASLARRLGGSPYHLQRNFKRIVGITPRQYAEACRQQRVRRGLRGRKSITDATLDAGFGSSSRLYERAVPKLGMTPSIYRDGAVGVRITFTTVDSAVGRLLIAATPRGVCLVSMGRSDAELQTCSRAGVSERRDHARSRGAGGLDAPGAESSWPDARRASIFPSISRRPPFSGRSGRPWPRFRTARRGATAMWRRRSGGLALLAQSRARAPRIPWRWRSLATVSYRLREVSAAIGGGRRASGRCWPLSVRPRRTEAEACRGVRGAEPLGLESTKIPSS